MKLLIDDASLQAIHELYNLYPIDGVTTNPTILSKAKRNPYEVLREIRSFIGEDAELHVQVVSCSTEDMIEEAHAIVKELGENTFVKIPSIQAGFQAIQTLKNEGYHVTATAVYTPMQAFLAAKAGADYVAPYINRIDNMGYDGIHVAKEIQDIFDANGLHTEILAASFQNSQQVLELCKYGIGASTVSPDVIRQFVNQATITSAVETFVKDFEGLVGKGNTMKTILK